MSPEIECLPIYTIPLLSWRPPDGEALAAGLRSLILEKERTTPGVSVTNIGGWHSPRDLQTWDSPDVRGLVEHMLTLVREAVVRTVDGPGPEHFEGWRVEAWANINRHGHANQPHEHTRNGNLWSGVFYVDTGDQDAGGRTFFQDRSGMPKEIAHDPQPFSRERFITPERGLMVLFPGTAWHYVEPYHGQSPRITIAFNLAHSSFIIPRYEPADFWWTNFRGVMRARQIIARKLRLRGRSKV